MAGTEIGRLDIGIVFNSKDMDASLTDVERKAEKTGGIMQVALGNMVANGIQTVIGKAGELAGSIVKTGMQFEASMSNVAAISGAGGTELDALTAKAREMGATTKFSATEASEALSYMAMAGWKTDQMLSGLPGIMNLAAAGGADLAEASDIVTDALTAFGQSASESARLADIMAAASSNSNTNIHMLGETFKYVAPVAGSLGYSMEDTSVAIGLMANAGIKGTQAGTTLRTTLTNLAKPSKEMRVAMEELGVSLQDDEGNMKTFRQVMDDLRSGFGNLMIPQEEFNERLSDLNRSLEEGSIKQKTYDAELERLIDLAYGAEGAEKAKYAAMLAGKESMSGLLAVVNASEEDYNKLTEAIDGSAGAAENMSKIAQDNLQGRITTLDSKIKEFMVSLYNGLKPALEAVVRIATGFADALNWLSKNADVVVPIIGGLAAAIGTYTVATKGAAMASKAWTTTTNIAKGAQTALNAVLHANPIGIIVAAVTGLVAGLVLLYQKCEPFRDFVNSIFSKVGEFFGWVGGKIGEFGQWVGSLATEIGNFFGSIATSVGEFFNDVSTFIGEVTTNIANFFAGLWETVVNVFSAIGEFLANIFAVPIAIVEKLIEIVMKIGEIIGVVVYTVVATAVQFFISLFQGVWNFMSVGITALGEWFSSLWAGLVEGLTAIGSFFSGVFTAVWEVISTVVENVKTAFQAAWDFLTGIFSGVGDWFKARFTEVYNNIKAVFATVGEFFKGVWENIVKTFTGIGEAVGNGIKSALAAAINFVLQAIETVVNAGIDFINGLINAVNNLADLVGLHIEPIGHLNLGRVQFAQGGIVPGTDFYGDHVPAMMNSGEMVLTRGQQGALWNAIESGSFASEPETAGSNVDSWARSIASAFVEELDDRQSTDLRPIEVTNNNYFENAQDADQIGDIILESMRRATA